MPDKPPEQLEMGTEPFNGTDYYTPPKEDLEEERKVQQMLAAAREYAHTHDLSGEKIDPNTISQEDTKGGRPTETVSENFKKFVDDHAIGLLMTPLWSQTTRELTNIPDDKETEKFLNYTINEAKNLLREFFSESPLKDVQRKYIMDELYRKLKEQNLTEPFRKSLKKFFEGAFYDLPTDFDADKK